MRRLRLHVALAEAGVAYAIATVPGGWPALPHTEPPAQVAQPRRIAPARSSAGGWWDRFKDAVEDWKNERIESFVRYTHNLSVAQSPFRGCAEDSISMNQRTPA